MVLGLLLIGKNYWGHGASCIHSTANLWLVSNTHKLQQYFWKYYAFISKCCAGWCLGNTDVVFMCVTETGQQRKPCSICNSGNSFTCLLLILSGASLSPCLGVTEWDKPRTEGDRLPGKLLLCTLSVFSVLVGTTASLTGEVRTHWAFFASGVHSSELASSMARYNKNHLENSRKSWDALFITSNPNNMAILQTVSIYQG